jgi:hypothetical protein
MTWGRLLGALESKPLLREVKKRSKTFEGGPMRDLTLCGSLSEASKFAYFYEALIHFGQQPIPFGKGYKAWQKRKRAALVRNGTGLHFLGRRGGNRTGRSK